ncbi:Beta-glucan synthesis-associated protein KRE6 [Candida viswanathii]|uniref:Beta-glucan synthesis-associated protein KRE6 n=1 Tax=Candida viswanathii TaxID=5486 RepID=A0A367YHD6_9ASCO|nr:Beta-glucan synthesis-associated protein KRE6 [Candida viswanathii]
MSSSSYVTTLKFKYLDNPFYYIDREPGGQNPSSATNDPKKKDVTSTTTSATSSTVSTEKIDVKKSFRFIIAIVAILVVFVLAIIFAIMSSFIINNPIRNGDKVEKLTDIKYPQLKAIRTSLIDPDTPEEVYNLLKRNGKGWTLAFSDEFELDGRTFHEGDDQFFTAVDIYYSATHDLEYYLPQMVTTRDSNLEIIFDRANHSGLEFVSGMVQSWNKLCFNKRAIVEIRAQLPYDVKHGLWPAAWSLGNLARPGFLATTDGTWPYTYDECDLGTLPNQSTTNEGMSYLPGQRLSKCACSGEDHPSPGVGRGAPEIDIIEGLYQYDKFWGVQTLQVAPFDEWWRPDYDYVGIDNENITIIREDIGTVYQESISLGTNLNTSEFHVFTMEYKSSEQDQDSYITFAIDGITTFTINGSALHPNQYIGWRQITKEPMSLVFNLGLSFMWNQDLDTEELDLPAKFLIDYVRIYQPEGQVEMTCDPVDYPTDQYIRNHKPAYENPNLTSWKAAGYNFPRNLLLNQCKL